MIPLRGLGWGKEAANDGNDSEREGKIRQGERSYIQLFIKYNMHILKPQN